MTQCYICFVNIINSYRYRFVQQFICIRYIFVEREKRIVQGTTLILIPPGANSVKCVEIGNQLDACTCPPRFCDVIFLVKDKPHHMFEREGCDLRLKNELPITL